MAIFVSESFVLLIGYLLCGVSSFLSPPVSFSLSLSLSFSLSLLSPSLAHGELPAPLSQWVEEQDSEARASSTAVGGSDSGAAKSARVSSNRGLFVMMWEDFVSQFTSIMATGPCCDFDAGTATSALVVSVPE